jgi:hypothetical protein
MSDQPTPYEPPRVEEIEGEEPVATGAGVPSQTG